jgi:hypothetical protein
MPEITPQYIAVAVRAARGGAFNVWLHTVHAAATLRPPIGVLADPAAT